VATSARSAQRGQAIVIVGLMLVVLFGFLGLALDSGRAYLDRRELQASVDAGALSAAYKYMNTADYTQAEQAATADYANNERLYAAPSCSGYGSVSATCTFGDPSGHVLTINVVNHSIAGVSFTATGSHTIPVAIMQVLGAAPTIPVSATATAVARHAGTSPAGIQTLSPNGCGGNGSFSLRITGTANTTIVGDVWSNGNINQNGAATATVTGNVVDICPVIPPSINGITLTPGSGVETNGWAMPDPGFPAPPINPAAQSWNSSDYNVVRSAGTYSGDPHLVGGAGCYFLAGGVYTFQSGFTIDGGLTSNELKPPDEPVVTSTRSALSGAVSSIPVVALSAAVPAGSKVTISGQVFTVTSAGAASGATSIPVNSQAVTGTIASGSTVAINARAVNNQFWDSNGVGCSGSFQPYPWGSDAGNPQINPATYGVEVTSVRWEAYGVPGCNGPASPTCFLRESAPSMCRLVDIASNQFLRVWVSNVPGAMAYNVYVSNGSCAGPFGYLGQINNPTTESNRRVSGCAPTFARNAAPSLANCDLGASGPKNFNGSNFSPDYTNNPPAGEGPPVGPPPLPNSDPGPLTAAPPAGDNANENQCVDSTGTRVACPPVVTPGYITPGAVVLFIPGGGACNPGALSMSGGGDGYLFSGQQYHHILLYEPGPEQDPPPNTCSNSIAGHGVTSLLGIFYLPAASVTITGSSGYLSTIAGGVIAWSATINGNGSVSIVGDPSLGTWPPAVHLTQ
jgi:Flp pilus assembly protein TadG